MNISLKKITSGLLLASVALIGNYARATPITGSITLGVSTAGTTTIQVYNSAGTNTGVLTSADTQISINGAVVTASSGSFTGSTNPVFGMTEGSINNDFIFATTGDVAMSIANDAIWHVTSGATTFTITGFGTDIVNAGTLGGTFAVDILGNANIADGNNADNTTGTFSLNISQSGALLTFDSTATPNPPAVPDGGATALLMALGLGGIALGVFAKRRSAVQA